MPLNNDEIRVAGNGRVYVAPKGTALPTDLTALAAAYVDVGSASEDGVVISRSVDQEGVSIWQSSAPARYLITGVEVTVAMTLMQFNEFTLPLYFGGGSVTSTGTAPNKVFSYNVSSAATVDERILVVEAYDGTLTYRYIFPRVMVQETDDLQLQRTAASGLGLTFGVLAPSTGTTMATVVTNDQNWEVPA
jgi:hypothetical protein